MDTLQNRWNFRLCVVFLLDSQFLVEASKFFAGMMTALATMVTLELPHVNVLSKVDLLDAKAKKELDRWEGRPNPLLVTVTCTSCPLLPLSPLPSLPLPSPLLPFPSSLLFHRYLDPESSDLLSELSKTTNKKYHKLNKAIAALVRGKLLSRNHVSISIHGHQRHNINKLPYCS